MNFLKYTKLYLLISALVIIPGVISLILYGIKPSIDFVGGSLLEVKFPAETAVSTQQLKEAVQDTYQLQSVQLSGADRYVLKGEMVQNETKNKILAKLQGTFQTDVVELRFETIGPTLSRELLMKTLTAEAIVAILITGFVARQFNELKYGLAAILAMFHDTLVLIGVFSLLGHFMGVEVDILFVTALLTTLSFSVHDTIVVFDRIRELKVKNPRTDFKQILNTGVTETLSRSLNNSMTTIIMLFTLSLLGGSTIRWFSIALLVGLISGTYSSPFVAVPLLLLWDKLPSKWRQKRN